VEETWSQYSISLIGILCVYILCCLFIYYLNFIKILYFDGLIFNCSFFMLIKLLNVVDRVWNDIV